MQTLTPSDAREARTLATLDALPVVAEFITANRLVAPTVEVMTTSPGAKPRAQVGVIGDPSEFVAWLRATGVTQVRVQARAGDTCAWANGEVGEIVYVLAGSMHHECGAVHLPGSGVQWDSGRYATLTLDAFVVGLRNSGHLPAEESR